MNIHTVTIVGVTGTMGANVAGIFASFGDAKVYCIGRDLEKVKNTLPRIVSSVRASSILRNLVASDFSKLEECVSESDFVFESCSEDLCVKTSIALRIATALKPGAISCTGSSGLSITKIAECYPTDLRDHFFGVHMFNPPYSMPLCELIPTVYSQNEIKEELKMYLEKKLLRTVVEVKDSPAFLGNRIGFQFINEALQYAERYKDNGGIDYIDAIIGSFTGRSMAPLVTSDFVGLDVHKAIVDNLHSRTHDYANDTFLFPCFAKKLVLANKLGRKTGEGLYKTIKYENGLKRKTVFDLNTGLYRDEIEYVFPFSEKMKKNIMYGDYNLALETLVKNHSQEAEICLSFLLRYIVYSVYASNEVAFSVEAADDVMAAGFNWCPPLALYDALSSVTDVKELIKERIGEELNYDYNYTLSLLKPSRYDYRPFFKSAHYKRITI